MLEQRATIAIGLVVLMVTVMALDARPATLDEILVQDSWSTGQVTIEGTIAEVIPFATSRGPMYGVNFQTHWYDWPFIWAGAILNYGTFEGLVTGIGPGSIYLDYPVEVGDHLRLNTEFYSFQFNGIEAVNLRGGSPLHPTLSVAIADVIDAVSGVQGMELILIQAGEWGTYEVVTDSISVNLQDLSVRTIMLPDGSDLVFDANIDHMGGVRINSDIPQKATPPIDSVHDWVVLGASSFVTVSDATGQEFDGNVPVPLREHPQDFAVIDRDRDGQLGNGDLLRVRFPIMEGDDETMVLVQLYSCLDEDSTECGAASKLTLVDADGPYEWHMPDR